MIIFDKKVGETPLEMLNRFRIEFPEYTNAKLSYAGRLDPMAEGKMIILSGEENKNHEKEKYLGLDKEYEATFLIGVQTDTGDALGVIQDTEFLQVQIDQSRLTSQIDALKKTKKQKYPWFSAMTIAGKKLFDHFKEGNTSIDRPVRDVEIKSVQLINNELVSISEIREYIFNTISLVNGDFRQKNILEKWRKFFDSRGKDLKMQTFTIKIRVSSGTFIRGLTENFDFPVTLLKLKRTRICDLEA